jgi:DNA-binding HxlR family transcriptional regulator
MSNKGAFGIVPADLAYQAEIMARALEVLGRKWALLILRDIAFLKLQRFGQILANNKGLSPRVLSRRLRELAAEGVIERVETKQGPVYRTTAKGEDALFILFAVLRYGMRHYGDAGKRR